MIGPTVGGGGCSCRDDAQVRVTERLVMPESSWVVPSEVAGADLAGEPIARSRNELTIRDGGE